ncbi:MAG: hypothetical protein ABR561_06310 [Guyparkeria sp.]
MSAEDRPKAAEPPQRGVFRTADLPPEERNAAWNAIAGPFFDHVVPLVDKAMDGEIHSDLLGNWSTCLIRFNPHSYARRKARDPEDGLDYYFIQLYRRGTLHGECAGRGVYVRPGDILILDVREALKLRASAGEIITLILPHAAIERLPADVHGLVLRHEEVATRQVALRFESLQSQLEDMDAEQVEVSQSAILQALNAAIDETLSQADVTAGQEAPRKPLDEVADASVSLQQMQSTLLDWSRRGD